MIKQKTRWTITPWSEQEEQQAGLLAETLRLSPLVARLLVRRGCSDPAVAERFLFAGPQHLHDPFLLKGMKEAAERIHSAGETGEKIRIYGDYDADGVSSTSLLVYLFRELGYDYDYYIPHRMLEGYGLNRKALELAAEDGVKLIVTVDTGISAFEEIEYAKELGLDVVVTDHHEPPERIPDAVAVVNPKQHDCPYPFKGLAGVGVAFKLAHALLGSAPLQWADIVCLGTIADLMPLTDENRILVREGLALLQTMEKPGFRALAEVSGIEQGQVTATSVGFGIAPRINAAGRLDHARRAVELLISPSYDEAILTASALDLLNKERQRLVEGIVKEAEEQWASKAAHAEAEGVPVPSVIVLAGEGWNVGIIGIVASKLLERHYKPTIIFGIDPDTGMAKGSARSIDGFDLHAALTECEALLDHYGGHQAAAGMSLHRDNLPALEQQMSGLADRWLTADDWIPKTSIDLICGVEEATLQTISQLSQLEPFGNANPSRGFYSAGQRLATAGQSARTTNI
ncbi:single-stranded-DNA-specific exonuclease RecJ [Paenibacillus protaetiae]|uniref:single-stranded-DNA-specific exonuclease RecJ n=1 Tax=Paenibacillus protaetiae TaxID=2509456 RepID=UPI0013EB5F73|nr:single-stranded-DNA-specific exonuclease RecJ [Paenibacillus protaetiae]